METLTDQIRIFSLLNRLKKERALLGVSLKGDKQAYNSAILDVSLDENYLTLDELKPASGHILISKTRRCRIKGQTQGVHLEFDLEIDKVNDDGGIAYYVSRLPPALHYLQRRASVRVAVSAAHPVPVTLTIEETASVIKGEMKDLSAGGLGIRFPQDVPDQVEVGQTLECVFASPVDRNEELICDIDVRLVKRKAEPHEPAFMGCEFLKLVPPQQRQISRMVMALQRMAQKKRSDT